MNELIFFKINSWAGYNFWLDQFMVFSAEWLGYFLILFLFIPILLTFLIKNNLVSSWARGLLLNWTYYKKMLFVAFGSAIVARIVIVEIIRFFYYSPRPFAVLENINQLVGHEMSSSFPSGHATFYFALATGLYLYNRKAGWIYFASAGLISFARVFSGVHWPLDIVVGAGVGIATSTLLNKLLKKY